VPGTVVTAVTSSPVGQIPVGQAVQQVGTKVTSGDAERHLQKTVRQATAPVTNPVKPLTEDTVGTVGGLLGH
jgi:hypothetical protein